MILGSVKLFHVYKACIMINTQNCVGFASSLNQFRFSDSAVLLSGRGKVEGTVLTS